MPRLTTHVLDTARGAPAASLRVLLRRAGESAVLAEAVTNADGRISPLWDGPAGRYALEFHAGDYLRSTKAALTDPPFLDRVPVEIALEQDSHVPLLLSPFGYSVYRGS